MPELDSGFQPPQVNTDHPSAARMYDYVLGGKDNYQVDRDALAKVLTLMPHARVAARQNRQFMHRAVGELGDLGVVQFLDIGTGIPTEPNVHQIAQQRNPEARVVYVDNDPMVLAHARALLVGSNEGRTAYISADLTEPESILASPELRTTLDLDAPVAVSMVAVLHFLTDEQRPQEVVRSLMSALAPGSFLVISHATADLDPAVSDALEQYRNSGVHARTRTKDEIARFFDGMTLLDPGIVPTNRWRPHIAPPKWQDAQVACWSAVARTP